MPIPRCEFCTAQPRQEVAVSRWTEQPDDRERVTIALCAKHLKRVQQGGDRGYGHRGVQYKLGFW